MERQWNCHRLWSYKECWAGIAVQPCRTFTWSTWQGWGNCALSQKSWNPKIFPLNTTFLKIFYFFKFLECQDQVPSIMRKRHKKRHYFISLPCPFPEINTYFLQSTQIWCSDFWDRIFLSCVCLLIILHSRELVSFLDPTVLVIYNFFNIVGCLSLFLFHMTRAAKAKFFWTLQVKKAKNDWQLVIKYIILENEDVKNIGLTKRSSNAYLEKTSFGKFIL